MRTTMATQRFCVLAIFLALSLAAAPLALAADRPTPEPGSAAERSKIVAGPERPDPKLPDVLVLGDSISIGYTPALREQLAGKANVYRPAENCNGTTYGLERLDRWLGD